MNWRTFIVVDSTDEITHLEVLPVIFSVLPYPRLSSNWLMSKICLKKLGGIDLPCPKSVVYLNTKAKKIKKPLVLIPLIVGS
jgi:hypothetical protein